MITEKVNVFEEKKMIEDGTKSSRGARHGGAGRIVLRTLALGSAIFAMLFMICCFVVSFSDRASTAGGSADISGQVTAALDGDGFIARVRRLIGSADTTSVDGASTSVPNGTDTTAVNNDTTSADIPTPTTPPDIYGFDYSLVPAGETPIIPYDLSLSSFGGSYIYNDTNYSPDIPALASANVLPDFGCVSAAADGAPIVLIIHTHGTEAYSPEGSISYDGKGEFARSTDTEKNVVAVGEVLCETLNRRGVGTLHCTVMHDAESYKDSYNRSAATIREYLAKYPSIQYVIDLHRDAVNSSSGSILRPVTLVGQSPVAQVMCVVGSDYGGADYPGWQKNLSFALKLRSALNEKYENLCRPVCLRSSAYNQQYAKCSLLLEVGTSGNYLSEAKAAARLVGETLADVIKG